MTRISPDRLRKIVADAVQWHKKYIERDAHYNYDDE
jgi:hypothetical protein